MEFGISSSNLHILEAVNVVVPRTSLTSPATYAGSDGVDNVTPTALMAFSCISDDDLEVGVLVEDLFDATVVASLLPRPMLTSLLRIVVFVIVAKISWSRDQLRGLICRGRRSRMRGHWSLGSCFICRRSIGINKTETLGLSYVGWRDGVREKGMHGGQTTHMGYCLHHSTF